MSIFHFGLNGREHGPALRRKFLSALTLCFPLASLWIVAGAGVVPALTEELLIPPVSAHKRTSAPAAARKPVTVSSSQEYAGWGGEVLVDGITHRLPGTLGWGSADFRAPPASAETT